MEKFVKQLTNQQARVPLIHRTRLGRAAARDRSLLASCDLIETVLESGGSPLNVLFPENEDLLIEVAPAEVLPGSGDLMSKTICLNGYDLTTSDLLRLSTGDYKIQLTREAEQRLVSSRNLIDQVVQEKKVVYGVTTGFGRFANIILDLAHIDKSQLNLIRSHAAGVGDPLTPERTRMLLALRINVLAKGCSGVTPAVVHSMIDAFNVSCLPKVPEKGSVGASGDLAPLSHLALGLMGEGTMWSPRTGWGEAASVLAANDLTPIKLAHKDGIAIINGTQLITSLGAEAVERAGAIARQADVVAALTVEALKGSSRPFDPDVHRLRPHKGQGQVADVIRALLLFDTAPSEIAESHRFCDRVQDPYTLRCCPQVHGVAHDTIDMCRRWITTELNSATDNPLVLADRGEIISAGNFHGEYPAKALDFLAIGVHELASMSERRMERLCNPAYSGLPAFLVEAGGINSGFMMAHVTAAALVSENKVLCHPSSVDSIPTSAGTEDHVSMGAWSARKALMVIENVERVIAIELLAACQAIEFLRPLKTTAPLEEVHKTVRQSIARWDEDRHMSPDLEKATELLKTEKIWNTVKHYIDEYYEKEAN